MKILSWNVNGLRSTVNRGFTEIIKKLNDDIICLQETKVSKEIKNLKLDKYYKYYNHPKRTSYAGVAIFTKKKPKNVYYGMQIKKDGELVDIDNEARVITLEFNQFYIVSVYVPRSRTKNERTNYRIEFNYNFKNYIEKLNRKKNTIVCGDFNTCYRDIDILNKGENRKVDIFFDEEKDGFSEFLKSGFVDTFRYMHPREKKYTFRASKLFDRETKYGWRLDYILVSSFMKNKIVDAKIFNEIEGSDHCPIELTIKIDECDNIKAGKWREYDFDKAENKLYEMQCELSKAALRRDNKQIVEIQNKITSSKEAKMLAVREVSETTKLVVGKDKVIWRQDEEKIKMAHILNTKKYKAKQLNKMGIQTMYDRAMQTLYTYALEPIAESLADRKSFGARKGRTNNNAHSCIMKVLNETKSHTWILVSKIDSFDNKKTAKWLLKNIPIEKTILNEFINAGYILNGNIFERKISKILKNKFSELIDNMLLDGMQKEIYNIQKDKTIDYYNGYCVRFANEVCIIARSEKEAEKIKVKLQQFLIKRGLKINKEETKISNINKGFDFLLRTYYKIGNRIKCIPSKKAVKEFEEEVQKLIFDNKEKYSQSRLIKNLNKKIDEFIMYHRFEESSKIFKYLDVVVNALLLKRMKEIHVTLTEKQIIRKFWKQNKFTLISNKNVYIKNMEGTKLINEGLINLKKNIFLDKDYFLEMKQTLELLNKITGIIDV